MEVRPIDANALYTPRNVRKVTEYDETGCGIDYLAVPWDVIKSAPTLDLASKWISVKDRLPGEDPVLILVKETEHYGYNKEKRRVYYCQYLAYWDGDEWFTTWCNGCRKISDTAKEPYADDYEVTHWMPLPEPPKEE